MDACSCPMKEVDSNLVLYRFVAWIDYACALHRSSSIIYGFVRICLHICCIVLSCKEATCLDACSCHMKESCFFVLSWLLGPKALL